MDNFGLKIGIEGEIEVVAELSRKAIYENAHIAQYQDEWTERNNGFNTH